MYIYEGDRINPPTMLIAGNVIAQNSVTSATTDGTYDCVYDWDSVHHSYPVYPITTIGKNFIGYRGNCDFLDDAGSFTVGHDVNNPLQPQLPAAVTGSTLGAELRGYTPLPGSPLLGGYSASASTNPDYTPCPTDDEYGNTRYNAPYGQCDIGSVEKTGN